MSLKSVDTSLERYLTSLYPNVVLASSNKAYEYGTDSNLQLKLPLITFDRLSNSINQDTFNFASTRRGSIYHNRSGGPYGDRDLPLSITYQITVWSDDRYECDDLWRELVMYIMYNPELDVEYENTSDNEGNPVHKIYTMKITNNDIDIDDSSFDDVGRLYRQIITIELPEVRMLFEKSINLVNSIPVRTVLVNNISTDISNSIQDDIDIVNVDKKIE